MTATYEKIATTTLGSNSATIEFTSISGTYTDIVLILSAKASGGNMDAWIQFNGDTGTNYSMTTLRANGSTVTSDRYTNLNYGYGDLSGYINTSDFNVEIIQFMNYSNTTTFKTFLSRASTAGNGLDAIVNLWRNTAAITSIKLSGSQNYATGTTATLYGIKSE
jgi:hypothetical protein